VKIRGRLMHPKGQGGHHSASRKARGVGRNHHVNFSFPTPTHGGWAQQPAGRLLPEPVPAAVLAALPAVLPLRSGQPQRGKQPAVHRQQPVTPPQGSPVAAGTVLAANSDGTISVLRLAKLGEVFRAP
jgi:hypothetical protein